MIRVACLIMFPVAAATTNLADEPAGSDVQSTVPVEQTPAETLIVDADGDAEAASESADPPVDPLNDDEFLQDPFGHLQSDMQSAVQDLKEGVTRPPAMVTQPRILSRLDLLIEQLERQGQGAGAAGQRATVPAQQSSLQRGPGGESAMRAARDDGRNWADLSPQERKKILQSRTDGFPAGYDAILADYFRRLAQGQSTSSGDDVDVEDSAN